MAVLVISEAIMCNQNINKAFICEEKQMANNSSKLHQKVVT